MLWQATMGRIGRMLWVGLVCWVGWAPAWGAGDAPAAKHPVTRQPPAAPASLSPSFPSSPPSAPAPALAAAAATLPLPAEVQAALRRAKLPDSALVAEVRELDAQATPRLSWNAQQPVNPASVFKLLTTQAALDLLGPAWSWTTPVLASGTLRDGVLDGKLLVRASGDPSLTLERLWLLLRRLRQLGVRELRGDWLLDRSAFAVPATQPGDFDGDASRPYNVQPDALLLNLKTVLYRFTPDPARGVAGVSVEPALAGVVMPSSVPLAAGPCDDWREALQPQWADALRPRFAGAYPASCGEKSWPVADADPASYNARLLAQLWRELGGQISGTVRDATARELATPGWRLLLNWESPPLAEVVRDINKYSNNVMAQQLFLTLAGTTPATPDDARARLRQWLVQRLGEADAAGVVTDNGSGLSRHNRVTAATLARLLGQAWHSPVQAELMASLPISGLDGTLRRSGAPVGRAHLKTGSLRDVAAVAGYLLTDSGRHRVLVAMVQHDNAPAARPALDALVQWALHDSPTTAATPAAPTPHER